MPILGGHDFSSKRKHYILGTSMTRPRCTTCWMQENMVSYYLFDYTTRKVSSTNIILEYLLLETTGKKLGEKEVQFNCFDRSCIRGFGNAWYQNYSKT